MIRYIINLVCSFFSEEPAQKKEVKKPLLKKEYKFNLSAYLRSNVAERRGVNNKLPERKKEDYIKKLETLHKKIIVPCVEKFGEKGFKINSGFRSGELNNLVGGSKSSQHMRAEAVDFEFNGVPNKKLFDWIKDNLDFDQLILEFYKENDPNSGWVHCSYVVNGNRKQAFKYPK